MTVRWSMTSNSPGVCGLIFILLAVLPSVVHAALVPTPIDAGSGDGRSFVQIDFTDGVTTLFNVSYDLSQEPSAFDLLSTLDSDPEIDLFLHSKDFGGSLGQFVFGLGFDGSLDDDHDENFSPGSWSYWVRSGLSASWQVAQTGVSHTPASSGPWHGFVFGTAFPSGPPRAVPEPSTLTMMALVAACLSRIRRRVTVTGRGLSVSMAAQPIKRGRDILVRATTIGRTYAPHRCVSLLGQVGVVIVCLVEPSLASVVDDPWADQVVSYTIGTNAFAGFTSDPAVALGPPERDTGELADFPSRVSSYNPPFGADEIVSIGAGGQLVVRFDQPVVDNPSDVRFGIDLLIFSNAFYVTTETGSILNVASEPGRVQVSQTGDLDSWIEVPGVFVDDLFPTEGYVDASGPFASDGAIVSDFTLPVDPAFDPIGMVYPQVVAGYRGSGGGTGVDISVTGLPWIQYVRVYQDPGDDFSTEIDAFADVPAPEPHTLSLIIMAGGCLGVRRGVVRQSGGRVVA